ncbi:bifunctional riboflavin kinase/FAD synthetase [Planktothrix sp. FACHB-1355]|uniref:Bifunctional riboflavin kinase/FMN adenylyltransferase n=1 Tax=Aerosakkonema funiforme FACHB-1375 TaxID=2949571 RepID=A0A926ZJB5_9CYAN|nr:bifunctional riboflavin kinase/FAD synthetase [Aerosakkonema funiforme]MBD2184835.1 bifunctional riboflavin kinase/FAD synthetase [Aerosakkonema funiforme FACHB-1375]MBD3561338.1 bifunctional riboflavin kinase/FAD synthetase [Planktothrix sp. FACHB-1355]
MWVTSSLTTALTPTAVALGNFDGVHRGHQQVVKPVLPESLAESLATRSLAAFPPAESRCPEDKSLLENTISESRDSIHKLSISTNFYATVVTFNPHPQEFFTGKSRALLTPPDEKVLHLASLGVEQLVMLPFGREMAALSPHEFVENILVQQLRAERVSVGQDFCFGYKRSGTSADLQAIAAKYDVEVIIVPIQNSEGERISSSMIRQALLSGDIERANRLLGRPYTLTGSVVKGQQLGRTLGFPTANLQLPSEKLIPHFGVYAVRVAIEPAQNFSQDSTEFCGKEKNNLTENSLSHLLPGVMNIGCRPTVNGTSTTVEIHLLDWFGDLYGKTITVSLEKFLRPEQKFASLAALKAQIEVDSATARALFIGNG